MGKGQGSIRRHGDSTRHVGREQRCIKCGRRIFYGDRCPPCAKELRQRQRRKPR